MKRPHPQSAIQYDPHHRSPTHLTDRNNSDLPIQQDRKNSELPNRKNSELPDPNRNNSEQQSEKLRTTTPDLICTVSDLTDDRYKHQPDQTKTDQRENDRKNSDIGAATSPNPQSAIRNPQLAGFLHRIQMRSPAYERILARDNLPEVVSWYWESLGQDWMDNPNGWIVRRLDQAKTPLPAYLEFAHAWLTMTEQDLQDYYAAGCHPYGLQDYWQEFNLSRDAITAHDSIKKAGGLDLFDDIPRPIISTQP